MAEIKEIWAVSFVSYPGPFLRPKREEIKQMDQRTRKSMNLHKTLHSRLYIYRKEKGKELASI